MPMTAASSVSGQRLQLSFTVDLLNIQASCKKWLTAVWVRCGDCRDETRSEQMELCDSWAGRAIDRISSRRRQSS